MSGRNRQCLDTFSHNEKGAHACKHHGRAANSFERLQELWLTKSMS